MKKVLIIVIVVLIIFVGCAIYLNRENINLIGNNQVEQKLAYVTLDINPSIELVVDENDKVVEAITLNEDADIAYSDLTLTEQSVEDATESIVDTAIELGHITEISDTNAVNVTSYAEDETRREKLNKKIVDKLNTHFETRKIYALVIENGLDGELKSKADSYDIPYGKMLLVSRAIQLDSSLAESDLVKLSVKEIQSKIKAQAVIRREEVKIYFKEGKQEFKDLKTKRIAEAKVKLTQDKETLLRGVDNISKLTDEQKQTLIDQRKNQIKEEIKDVRENLNKSGTTIKDNTKQNIKDKYLLKNK